MNIEEIRKTYPQYNDLPDQELVDGFHQKFYSDIPKDDFYSKVGLSKKEGFLNKVKRTTSGMLEKGILATGAESEMMSNPANAEILASGTMGMLAPMAGGLITVGGLVGGQYDPNIFKGVTEALTPEPKTEIGKKGAEIMAAPFEWLKTKGVESGKIWEEKGQPELGAISRFGGEALPWLAGLKGAVKPKIIGKSLGKLGDVVDAKTKVAMEAQIKPELSKIPERPKAETFKPIEREIANREAIENAADDLEITLKTTETPEGIKQFLVDEKGKELPIDDAQAEHFARLRDIQNLTETKESAILTPEERTIRHDYFKRRLEEDGFDPEILKEYAESNFETGGDIRTGVLSSLKRKGTFTEAQLEQYAKEYDVFDNLRTQKNASNLEQSGDISGKSFTPELAEINKKQTEVLKGKVKTQGEVAPINNERGSFSLKYTNDVRDTLKSNLPQETPAGKVNAMYERTEGKRAAREEISFKNIKDGLVRAMVDVSGNIKREVLKKDPLLGKQIIMDRELLAGASSKAAVIADEAGSKIFQGLRSDELEVLNRVIQSRRIIEIDNYKTGIKHPEGLTGKEHAEYLNSLVKINPELSKKINARADEYFNVMREQVGELQKEGILSQESAQALIEHEYSPRRFFQYLDPENSFNMGGRKITVPDSGIKALDEGSLQLLENNAEWLIGEVIVRTQARIFRNRANKSLYEFAEKVPDNGIVRIAKEVSRTKDGKPVYEDTPGGFEKVKVMIDGKAKEMIMPWEMAQEWVKSDPLINQTLATVVGTLSGAKILRPIATGYNPGFALTNIPRDVGLIWTSTIEYSSHLPIAAGQLLKDFIKVAPDVMRRTGRVKEYINEGGGMTFLTHYGRFSGKGFIGERLNSLGNIMGWIGETSEIWSRMALRERAIANGATPKEGTWIARRYLDFNQGGNVAKGIDTAIPYLNAAIQGIRGLMRGAKNNPAAFTYKMAQLGTVSVGLYLANYLTNPECWQSVTDREKEANFIITTPIYFTDDKGQKKYYYMKIAKDQGHRVVTSLFDALMAKQFEGKLPTKQVLMGFQDLISIAGLPPTLAAGISYLMNKDTWTNEDVWKGPEGIEAKEEYRKSTHPFWVTLGQASGLSPERMSNAAGKIIPPNNPFVGMVGGGYKIATGDLPQEIQDKSAAQFITEIPTVRRVLSTTSPYTPYRESIEEIKKAETTRLFTQNRTFDDLAEKYFKTRDQKYADEMIAFASTLPEPDQDRLTRRLERNARLYQIPDRAWYLATLDLPPEAKAFVFWDRYSKSSKQEQQKMLEIADQVGGFESERFINKLEELASGHPQSTLSNE